MKQSGHLNPSEKTGTGCPVTSNYGKTPPNKHGGEGPQQPNQNKDIASTHHQRAGGVALVLKSPRAELHMTQPTIGGSVTAVLANCCANCLGKLLPPFLV